MVTNTPDVLTNATAELALALTLAAAAPARAMPSATCGRGDWRGWDPSAYRGIELSGATVGIVGMGRIGRRYAELLKAFGVEILYSSPLAEAGRRARRSAPPGRAARRCSPAPTWSACTPPRRPRPST